jgi:peptidoglycan/LPS O-acetylase OafA/YrhL
MQPNRDPAMNSSARPRSSPILALDLVRGIAAIMVLLVHVRGGTWVEYGALPEEQKNILTLVFFLVTRLGQEAVMVFFVLSGFLVGGKIISRLMAGSFSVADYAIDRTTRILLPLVPACIFTVLLDASLFGIPISVGQTLANMVGLNGVVADTLKSNVPLWSLAYEIWFYIVGGALGCLIAGKGRFLAFVVLGVSIVVFAKTGASYILFWTIGAFAIFIIGLERKAWPLVLGVVAIVVGVALFQLGLGSKSIVSMRFLPLEAAEALMCVGFCLCLPLLCTAAVSAGLRRFSGIISFISAISYSVYLFHYPITTVLNTMVFQKYARIDFESSVVFVVKIAITLALCIAFYFAFERNTSKVRAILRTRFVAGGMASPDRTKFT